MLVCSGTYKFCHRIYLFTLKQVRSLIFMITQSWVQIQGLLQYQKYASELKWQIILNYLHFFITSITYLV